jgi:hypothetical protein
LVLITLTVTVGRRIEQQAREKVTIETINLVDAALGEFRDFDYQYKGEDYRALKFPVDCNGLNISEIQTVLQEAFSYSSVSISAGGHDPNSGCEIMYFILNMVPASRDVLDEIDQSLILKDRTIIINGNSDEEQPLLRIADSWGTTLHYSYYDNEIEDQPGNNLDEPPRTNPRPFPVITSAGQDKKFGTADDITNR